MYMHTLARFCESRRRFFSLLSLKYLYISFFYLCLSVLSLLPACCRVPPRSPPPLPGREAIRASSLSAFPPLALRSCSCRVFRGCRAVCPLSIGHAPEAPRRPSVCRAVCRLVAAVTRPPSGAKRCDSVGRCTAYISPALSPLAYVLPCVPLSVPLLVPWLVLPAAVCRLVVIIAYTPLYPGRLRCGAASEV